MRKLFAFASVFVALMGAGTAQAGLKYSGLFRPAGLTPNNNTVSINIEAWDNKGVPTSHGAAWINIQSPDASNWVQTGIVVGNVCGNNLNDNFYTYVEVRRGGGTLCGGCPGPDPHSCGYDDGAGHSYSFRALTPIAGRSYHSFSVNQNVGGIDRIQVLIDGTQPYFGTGFAGQRLIAGTGEVSDPNGLQNQILSSHIINYNQSWVTGGNYHLYGSVWPTNLTPTGFYSLLP